MSGLPSWPAVPLQDEATASLERERPSFFSLLRGSESVAQNQDSRGPGSFPDGPGLEFAIWAVILILAASALSWTLADTNNGTSYAYIIVSLLVVALLVVTWRLSYSLFRLQSRARIPNIRLMEAQYIEAAAKNLGLDSAPRLGALYMLERLAMTSRDSAGSIVNSLLNFIRTEAALSGDDDQFTSSDRARFRVSDDIQTALAILGRLRTTGRLSLDHRIDLSYCNLSGARLKNWDFSGVDFHNTVLDDCDLNSCNFDNANLPYSSFARAHIVNTSFKWAIAIKASFDGALLINNDLANAVLAEATFDRAQLHHCRVNDALLTDAQLTNALFVDVDLDGANMDDAVTTGSTIRRRDVRVQA